MSTKRVSNLNKAQYISGMSIENPHPLPVRKLHVDLSQGFRRHWHSGDAFRSAYFNALSMSFPAGEQKFIDSVLACVKLLPLGKEHDALRAQLRDFCAQEATHRHVHAQYNAVLEKQGLVNHWEPRIARRFARAAHINPLHHLAITAAFEHYTTVFAEVTLTRPDMLAQADPAMRSVWLWHGMEETEHKSVAFDLYQTVSGNYAWRRRWFFYVSVTFAVDALRQTVNNLWHDGTLFKPGTWVSALQFFWGRPSRGGGWFWLTARRLTHYLHRDFHPWQHNNQADAQNYAAQHANEWRVVR